VLLPYSFHWWAASRQIICTSVSLVTTTISITTMPFAQLVIGPPGSGKSTYCDGMHQFLSAIGRPSAIVNLDPANDHTSYKPALDVRSLIPLEEIMADDELGPNGAVLHALETLEHNIAWLLDGLRELGDDYILFDCPGQVELFTHHNSLRNIFYHLQKANYRLVVVNLVDSLVLSRPSLYISSLLLCLRSMLQLDLPTIHALTKIDQLASRDPLPLPLEFYTEVHDLSYLLPWLEREQRGEPLSIKDPPSEDTPDPLLLSDAPPPPPNRLTSLNTAITSLITSFALVAFEPLYIEDKTLMASFLHATDKASGYAFGSTAGANESVWGVAVRQDAVKVDVADVQERWVDRRAELDEVQREEWRAEREARRAEMEEDEGEGQDEEDEFEADLKRGVDVGGIKVVRVGDAAKKGNG
jgi:GPN-loop GTPase